MTNNIEIYPDTEGGWRFRVRANNGQIVGVGESYATKPGAEEGVNALRRALGLEEEWGVRTGTRGFGETDLEYGPRTTAEMVVDDIREEVEGGYFPDDANPRLIRRLVTEWEEVDD